MASRSETNSIPVQQKFQVNPSIRYYFCKLFCFHLPVHTLLHFPPEFFTTSKSSAHTHPLELHLYHTHTASSFQRPSKFKVQIVPKSLFLNQKRKKNRSKIWENFPTGCCPQSNFSFLPGWAILVGKSFSLTNKPSRPNPTWGKFRGRRGKLFFFSFFLSSPAGTWFPNPIKTFFLQAGLLFFLGRLSRDTLTRLLHHRYRYQWMVAVLSFFPTLCWDTIWPIVTRTFWCLC